MPNKPTKALHCEKYNDRNMQICLSATTRCHMPVSQTVILYIHAGTCLEADMHIYCTYWLSLIVSCSVCYAIRLQHYSKVDSSSHSAATETSHDFSCPWQTSRHTCHTTTGTTNQTVSKSLGRHTNLQCKWKKKCFFFTSTDKLIIRIYTCTRI